MFDGKCSCIHCKEVRSAKGIHVHVDRTHLGSTKYSSGNNGRYDDPEYKKTISDASLRAADLKFGKKETRKEICDKCNKEFDVTERSKREKYFCSRSCANSHIVTEGHKKKTSETMTGRKYSKYKTVICSCGKEFQITESSKKKYCTVDCRRHEQRKCRSALTNYRTDAAFRFNLKDYPNRFDFALIEQFGWYKAANRGNNLNGVSRDHMVSVRYGFDNNIPAEIIGHPANCRLIRHNENSAKHSKCSMTIGELFARILLW